MKRRGGRGRLRSPARALLCFRYSHIPFPSHHREAPQQRPTDYNIAPHAKNANNELSDQSRLHQLPSGPSFHPKGEFRMREAAWGDHGLRSKADQGMGGAIEAFRCKEGLEG
ncbi:hypothetical protein BC826DRAFT_701832 [Russula brevipes]|nr:hypothetical protein BC826DRAFT_701832 [Russula brevipes]